MDQIKIRCFMVLAQTLNFTKAAEQVFLTQQAVSHSIASLEQELGLQLFERSTRSVRLTAEGQKLYSFFSRTELEYELLLEDLRKSQNPFLLHVGYQNFISFFDKLRKARVALSAQYPELEVSADRFTPPAMRNKLQQHELDLVVIYSRFFREDSGYRYLPLCSIHQYFMVSDELAVPEDEPLEALRALPFIIDKVEHETPAELKKRIKMERELWGFTGETLIVSDRDSAYTHAEMGRGVVVGTDLSIMSSGRALKFYNVGIPEQLVAVWREDEANPVIPQYAEALRRCFELPASKG